MENSALSVALITAPDEPPFVTPEAREAILKFQRSFAAYGINVEWRQPLERRGAGAPLSPPLGELLLQAAATIGPIVGTAVGVWLQGKYGRKVRLKIGEIEAEAQTVEEVEKLIDRALELQERNQPRKVTP